MDAAAAAAAADGPAAADAPRKKAGVASQLVAGAAAGLLADTAMHPLNTAQTNLQSGRAAPRRLPQLYRGFAIVALFSVPSHGLYFSVYDSLRDRSPAAAGLAAELTGTLLLTPSEVLKKRTQLAQPGYRAPLPALLRGVAADLRRAPGPTVRDLYTGLALSCAVWLPFSALYFDVYERLRARAAPVWAAATAGGGVAAAATAPLDVVLTRLQTRHGGAATFRAAVRGVARDRAWFRGVGARVAWLAPSAGISLTAYEALAPRLDAVTFYRAASAPPAEAAEAAEVGEVAVGRRQDS